MRAALRQVAEEQPGPHSSPTRVLLRNGSGADFRHPLAAGLDDGVQRAWTAPRSAAASPEDVDAKRARDVSIRMRNMAANSRGRRRRSRTR